MIFDKTNTRNYVLCVLIFITGMLSVSVANVFGGYYCSVAAIEAILLTMIVYGLFDKKDGFKDNIISLTLCSVITFFGIVFFVVNDIFNVDVYSKSNLNFWGVCVIVSQLLAILSLVYLAINVVVGLNKSKIEVVDHKVNDEKAHEEIRTGANERIVEEEKYEEEVVEKKVEPVKEEVKSITDNNVKVEPPFMEEER